MSEHEKCTGAPREIFLRHVQEAFTCQSAIMMSGKRPAASRDSAAAAVGAQFTAHGTRRRVAQQNLQFWAASRTAGQHDDA